MRRLKSASQRPDPRSIDELYGLEPVLEPGQQPGTETTAECQVRCPYCGEHFGTVLDLSAGSTAYIEDCQVCCQPIEMRVSVDDDGGLRGVEAARTD